MEMVIEMYDELCKDSVPMIRKAAINVIPEFIKVMDVCDGDDGRMVMMSRKKHANSFLFVLFTFSYVMTRKPFACAVIKVVLR